MVRVGDKVIAILDAKDGKVRSFGEGVYDGDMLVSEQLPGIKNPRITLDAGGHVWGYECWWGAADAMRRKYAEPEWTWVPVDIVAHRAGRA